MSLGTNSPIKPLKAFQIWAKAPGAKQVEARFTMEGMDMGFNLYTLRADAAGRVPGLGHPAGLRHRPARLEHDPGYRRGALDGAICHRSVIFTPIGMLIIPACRHRRGD